MSCEQLPDAVGADENLPVGVFPEIAAMCYRANGHEGRATLCLGNVIINALELFRHYFA